MAFVCPTGFDVGRLRQQVVATTTRGAERPGAGTDLMLALRRAGPSAHGIGIDLTAAKPEVRTVIGPSMAAA